MLNSFLMLAGLIISTSASAADSDLVLEGERWLAKGSGYLCASASADEPTNAPSGVPQDHAQLNVNFEQLTTDYTLDHALIKGSFRVGKSTCRYSALLFANNQAKTIKLVQSKAFASTGESNCAEGKERLDAQLSFNEYLYWGRPHHVTILIPNADAARICGPDASHVGVDFTAAGKISP